MKQEDKELLIREICARLPYGVIAKVYSYWNEEYFDDKLLGIDLDKNDVLAIALPGGRCEIDLVKPYLRPLSSMTVEEKEYIKCRWCYDDWTEICDFLNNYKIDAGDAYDFTDWLNAHHFDYRGLIDKGLALEAPANMYKTK